MSNIRRPLIEMTRAYHSSRRVITQITPPFLDQGICNRCYRSLQRRYASTSTAIAATPSSIESSPPTQHTPPATESTSPRTAYEIKASVVLSRPPILTRDLHPFEKAFFLYQRRLNERLALPFTRYFYYQKDTPGDTEWKSKIKERKTPARDIGVYSGYGDEAWNDELLVGAKESEPQEQIEALLRDAEQPATEDEEGQRVKKEKIEKPMPRVTEADRTGDVKSLNRALTRTLYLVVKTLEGGTWRFPSSTLIGGEDLHRAAERIIVQTGGINMNTWIVGNAPVGHHNLHYPQPVIDSENRIERLGEKTFFMKARIMAGQPNIKENKLGVADFKWLAKEEVRKEVKPHYWASVKNMLAER